MEGVSRVSASVRDNAATVSSTTWESLQDGELCGFSFLLIKYTSEKLKFKVLNKWKECNYWQSIAL